MLQCQQERLVKQYFIYSLWLHFAVMILFFIASCFQKQQQKFIVLGAHSSKDSQAYFRPLVAPKHTVPKAVMKKSSTIPSKKIKPIVKKPPVIKKKPSIVKKSVLPKKPEVKKISTPAKKVVPVKKQVQKAKIEKPHEQLSMVPIDMSGDLDPKLARYQREVRKEVARLWRPPVGVPKGTECILQVTVDAKGSIELYELTTRSKVLVYDLSVLQAAKEFKFSKALWGNSLIITFRQ